MWSIGVEGFCFLLLCQVPSQRLLISVNLSCATTSSFPCALSPSFSFSLSPYLFDFSLFLSPHLHSPTPPSLPQLTLFARHSLPKPFFYLFISFFFSIFPAKAQLLITPLVFSSTALAPIFFQPMICLQLQDRGEGDGAHAPTQYRRAF